LCFLGKGAGDRQSMQQEACSGCSMTNTRQVRRTVEAAEGSMRQQGEELWCQWSKLMTAAPLKEAVTCDCNM
jgi:hypothetical protein